MGFEEQKHVVLSEIWATVIDHVISYGLFFREAGQRVCSEHLRRIPI